jgi:hypothetical protein
VAPGKRADNVLIRGHLALQPGVLENLVDLEPHLVILIKNACSV